jgi:hypothetical protein
VDYVGLCYACIRRDKLGDKENELYSLAHFANCTSDRLVGTCRMLPIIGEPLGPGGSGNLDSGRRE